MAQLADMPAQPGGAESRPSTALLADRYHRVRATSLAFADGLAPEDTVVQSMPDVSPTKWHLAHTTWFFEHFVLREHAPGYALFDERYHYLFNSYYYTVGQMHRRAARGLLSRPTLDDIRGYRAHVDRHMNELLDGASRDDIAFLVQLGLHHEQQHQELILTDIKHVFSRNPLLPVFREIEALASPTTAPVEYIGFDGGIVHVGAGAGAEGFNYDNETPRHEVLLRPFALADRPVTNSEYREFVRDGGYEQPDLWLSDGWATVQNENWRAPIYWSGDNEAEFTLAGLRELDLNGPVCHLSYYEADAFARWAGARLPTEFEWEHAAPPQVHGNLLDTFVLHPCASDLSDGLRQMYGDVWEWTSSPYAPYPGFRPLGGSLGEYNGKFMCSQLVLRGGSCATPADHIRATYRNFFYPHQRWQFSGIRLARDA